MVTYEKASDSLRSSRICCESIARFRYDQLSEDEIVSFKLDASSDAFDFQSGKSYFKAFRLPEKVLPYRIRIASFPIGESIARSHIFYPQVAVLNDHFAIVTQSAPGDFSLRKTEPAETGLLETWAGAPFKIEGYVTVDDPGAKYLLVFTTQQLMSSASPYEMAQVIPIILPGVVGAIPGGKKKILIRHSPFGLLHVEMAGVDSPICQHGSESDIEPQSAITGKLVGRDARLFVAAVEPGIDATGFDAVVILRGPDVPGGTVAVVLNDSCFLGRKFLSALDYIHATQMVTLFRTSPALQNSDHLEIAALQAMAEAGDPAAQFHVGLAYAWGRGMSADRSASIEWLKRAAQIGFSPAMLALGMALSGPGAILDEARIVGQPPRSDEFTDLAMAYFWLDAANRSSERNVKGEASFRLGELARRMSPEELRKAKELVRERMETPY